MKDSSQAKGAVLEELIKFYEDFNEEQRLSQNVGKLERARTQEILKRYLSPPPCIILDVGGGAGAYSFWLAKEGYEVHLIDPVPLHVEQARQAAKDQPDYPLASIKVGDANHIDLSDSSIDSVLFFGPLYHITERDERISVLKEARRVLRKGGFIFAVGISRFASILDGLFRGYLDDPEFQQIVKHDLVDGQHRNPTGNPLYFTTAFFHHPEEIIAEINEAGFQIEKLLAIDGPGWLLQNFEMHWNDNARRERLLKNMRILEEDPSLLGISAHIMAIARKPA